MKSTIPAIVAIINERIDEYEVQLDELQTEMDRLHDEFREANEELEHKAGKIRTKLKRLNITSTELSDMRITIND